MSTVSAIDTIDRFVELFPPHRQRPGALDARRRRSAAWCRSDSCRGPVAAAGSPAVEILVVNARVRERIADPTASPSSTEEMTVGDLYGMQTFDQSLVQLYRNGLVARADAVAHADAAGRDALRPRPRRPRTRTRRVIEPSPPAAGPRRGRRDPRRG